MFGQEGVRQPEWKILDENEIVDGIDELGVLLYGHGKNAYWYGSQLSIEETRQIAPYQNATGLQVSSAVLAGMVWALENPRPGSSRLTTWTSAAAWKCRRLISARSSASTRIGPRLKPPGAVPGGYRHGRSLAVPQRAGALRAG